MKKKKVRLDSAPLVVLLLLAAVCLICVLRGSNQAALSTPRALDFTGEYSYDGENWSELTDSSELSAFRGSLTLRGHFNTKITEGGCLEYYRNHIGVSMCVNGEKLMMDSVTECAANGVGLLPSMCGAEWYGIALPDGIEPEDEVEIYLYNPHTYGNKHAYREFLITLCCGSENALSELLQKNLEPYGVIFRGIGGMLVIAALFLFGASVAAFLRTDAAGSLMKIGLMTLYTGGYFVLDTIDVCFWIGTMVLNTYARQLCMMLAVFCLGDCICDALTGKMRQTARVAVGVSALVDSVLIILSFTGGTVIYDTLFFWAASQWILCPLLAVCCVVQLCGSVKKDTLGLVSGFVLCITVLLDIAGVGASILCHGTCSKGMFCLFFLVYVFVTGRRLLNDYRASDRLVNLEQELQESRISIMLSQLQPHFLFNVLNSIYYLCGTQPEKAKTVVEKFSTYLRDNMDSLVQKEMVPFHKEFEHIQTYLELEKIRFDEELTVVYDIQTENFLLPVLTVQPLVENAVKHGITKKRGGGVLMLSTQETPECYVVTVSDTGVGFDQDRYMNDGKTHIGIENVRLRLEDMAGGTLKITSSPGQGTDAVITIPKKGAK